MSSLRMKKFELNEFQKRVTDFLHIKCNDYISIDRENLIQDHSIDDLKASQWISEFQESEQEAAKELLNLMVHISWKDFKHNLLQCAKETMEICKSVKKDYWFVSSGSSNGSAKSDTFFTSIAYENVFLKENFNPVYSGDIPEDKNLVAVYVDDMSYSGSQLVGLCKNIIEFGYGRKLEIKEVIVDNSESSWIWDNMLLPTPLFDIKNEKSNIKQTFTIHNAKDYNILNNGDYKIIRYTHTLISRGKELSPVTLFLFYYKVKNVVSFFSYPETITGYINLLKSFASFIKNCTEESPLTTSKFSGLPLSENFIQDLERNVDIILCLPYISSDAHSKIKNLEKSYSVKIHFPKSCIVISNPIKELDDETDLSKLVTLYTEWGGMTTTSHNIIPYYFDHKLASPVSTLSTILGCGIVLSEKKISAVGSLLKNCNVSESEMNIVNIFKLKFFENKDNKYDPDSDESVCTYCPYPVYKYSQEDICKHVAAQSIGYVMNLLKQNVDFVEHTSDYIELKCKGATPKTYRYYTNKEMFEKICKNLPSNMICIENVLIM